jgi:hypothetical protein
MRPGSGHQKVNNLPADAYLKSLEPNSTKGNIHIYPRQFNTQTIYTLFSKTGL